MKTNKERINILFDCLDNQKKVFDREIGELEQQFTIYKNDSDNIAQVYEHKEKSLLDEIKFYENTLRDIFKKLYPNSSEVLTIPTSVIIKYIMNWKGRIK